MSETIKSFACRVGLCLAHNQSAFWVESPRTGKRVIVLKKWFPRLPPRVASRIVQQVSLGRHEVPFTPEELKQIKVYGGRTIEETFVFNDQPVAPAGHTGKWEMSRHGRKQFIITKNSVGDGVGAWNGWKKRR